MLVKMSPWLPRLSQKLSPWGKDRRSGLHYPGGSVKVALDLIYSLRRAGRPMHASTGPLTEILQVGFGWAQSAILTAGIEIV